MIPDSKHPNGVPTAEELRPMYLALGICPYCKRNMDKRTNGKKSWWYCYGCFNNFNVPEGADEKGN